ncbi:hypothetical protein EI42_04786 [Thermosporothrix hazakensis]|uniref:Serine active site containing 1-like protein n=1 Tax=Thermosporothrix hazakensis TaxID=644383 RepID=A0A326UDP1_THEHA|nr:hypothetical protein [Thermosporothrix hazakensis]PZW24095.1 hypothetical protein EI42_04786 [Thermosporothrix hazakensis]GCE50307.1 hypothetical protein KTH_51760 [Thermosporothrix hazakensis]
MKKISSSRQDLQALWWGIAFSLLFTGIIWGTGFALRAFPHLPKPANDPSWYYWKLPAPTIAAEVTAWGGYLLHQLFSWGVIWYAQTRRLHYSHTLHTVNKVALAGNALFILLHLLQSLLWYDGLAANVSVFSSQGSVIVLLVWVLLMENPRRGLFFGKKLPLQQRVIQFARKYHGYFFSWAIIYTFWYHPTENTPGHLVGFLYMFLLMLQSSLFFTRVHINPYWTFVQEILVLAHGTLVALMQANGLWPMFFFGFAAIFIITQMHGLRLKSWIKWGLTLLLLVGAIVVYSMRGVQRLWELVAIPLIDYPAVLVLFLLLGLIVWLTGWRRPRPKQQPAVQPAPDHLERQP